MKTIISIHTVFLITLMLTGISGNCQNSQLSSSKIVEFHAEATPTEIKVSVTDEFNYLRFYIQGFFEEGEVEFKIFDPNGISKGGFIIKTDSDVKKGMATSIKSSVTGKMSKSYRNPEKGNWLIQIKPLKRSTGRTEIKTLQIFNPKADILELDQIEKSTGSSNKK